MKRDVDDSLHGEISKVRHCSSCNGNKLSTFTHIISISNQSICRCT